MCYVERDAFAASCLVGGMENAALDRAPVFDDLCAFDGRPWRGVVDLISAGLPCQPYSVAGKRRGNDDERALWPELVRIVRECEPAFVFIENTPEFLTHAEPVWRELRGLGFEWEEPLFATASHVGAIHGRRRVFLLASHPDRAALRLESGRLGGASWPGAPVARDAGDAASDAPLVRAGSDALEGQRGIAVAPGEDSSDSSSIGRPERRPERRPEHARLEGRPGATERDPRAPHADLDGLESEWCGWVFDRERQTFRHDLDRCNPRCRIAGTVWDSESPVCRVGAGYPYHADLLRVLGNAVPPQQTELAFERLFQPFTTEGLT